MSANDGANKAIGSCRVIQEGIAHALQCMKDKEI